MREMLVTTLSALVLTPVILASISFAGAQVMESTNYRIAEDSVNFGGGNSTSTNYTLESTGGEIATGESSSNSYRLKAGYQQMLEVYLSLSGFSAVTMSPSIPGISGGIANGSTAVLVLTDSPSGYQLQISSSQSPAMQKGVDSIADYAPMGAVPDLAFITDPADAQLGYTPEGPDIATRFQDDGAACGTGSGDTALACWDGLSTTPRTIATRTSANQPNGSTTTVNFRVGVGGAIPLVPGTYVATTTLTLLAL